MLPYLYKCSKSFKSFKSSRVGKDPITKFGCKGSDFL